MKYRMPLRSLSLLSVLVVQLSCHHALIASDKPVSQSSDESAQTEFFESRIRPVLVENCYSCHSVKSGKSKGGLLLDSRQGLLKGGDSGPAVVAGNPEESVLLLALRYEELQMPPKQKLSDQIIQDFEHWIREGASDPREGKPEIATHLGQDQKKASEFWAFQKPAIRPPSPVRNQSFISNQIDRYVLNQLEANGLRPSVKADKKTLIRRAYFDLVGLPPTPQAVDAFLNDHSPEAFEKVVDQLLASPHYGERWGRHWLDLARYAEDQAHTFKARMYPQGYLYRDWVIQALNDDMPYNEFLKLQVAADLIHKDGDPKNLAALGLFALGPVYYQDNGEKDKALADEWDDRLDTLMRGTQALTVACARCHDHKYDPISMDDYYGLAGIFASSEYAQVPIVSENVVKSREEADRSVLNQQLSIDSFLAGLAPEARLKLSGRISDYLVSAWEISQKDATASKNKKLINQTAAAKKLDEELLKRWLEWLSGEAIAEKLKSNRPLFGQWSKLKASLPSEPTDEARLARVKEFASSVQRQVEKTATMRQRLLAMFGENLAFSTDSDRAEVEPGMIPLGNLFDDKKGVNLESAVTSDPFRSVATAQSLGVDRVLQGWGSTVTIANGIRLNVMSLGSDSRSHGQITNDAWSHSDGGIRTTGKKSSSDLPRTEQGIGMHANALITFDLAEIRKAGLIPAQDMLKFVADRAGINDDAFGQGSSVHIAVVLSKPHVDKSRYDAIISSYVNGVPCQIIENDTVYYFEEKIPKPLRADGKFAKFDIPVPPEARFLTIIVTGAEISETENTINSDHAVLSNVRLLYKPTKEQLAHHQEKRKTSGQTTAELEKLRSDALILSELFDEQGLLGLPFAKIESLLDPDHASQLNQKKNRLAELKTKAEAISVPKAHSLVEGTSRDLNIYLSGDPKKQGSTAVRSFPTALTGGKRKVFQTGGSGRLDLAETLASSDNPITARVAVNRIWAGHFGTGLVRTINNFGSLGERPSHPDLLDYLACQLMNHQWSQKAIHREIMLSSTYQQSSISQSEFEEKDPENRLLWRMNRRRMEIEPWRDSILAVSGSLDPTLGGPSSRLNESHRRRTLYGYISRHQLDELLRLFDFPDPNITSGQRPTTTVPLQQLFILNSDFMLNQAKALAARLKNESNSGDKQIQSAFQLVFSRKPTVEELQGSKRFLDEAARSGSSISPLEQFALALIGSNEFTFVD